MLDIKFVRENQEAVAQAMKNRHAEWDGAAFAALDERLNSHFYIVPGLGDAGDRIFGTL